VKLPVLLGRQLVRRPRSIRARLVATYVVVAILLASIGLILFTVLVHRSLKGSFDASLATRATPVVAALGQKKVPDLQALIGSAGAKVGPAGATLQPEIDAVTFVLRPNGTVAATSSGLPPSLLADGRHAITKPRPYSITTNLGDDELRVLFIPVSRQDGTWVVAAGANLQVVKATANEATHQLYVAVPFLILLAAIGAWLLSGAALEPVERMRIDAETIGERDLDTRISVPDTADELARLANTFNALLDRLRGSVDRQRDLVADAGHELRTPLAVLRTELELADRPDRTKPELLDAVGHARTEVERLTRLAEDLLFLARADGNTSIVSPRDTDIVWVIGGAVRSSRARAEAAGVTMAIDAPGELRARVDPDAVRRAVDNLLANSLVATSPPPAPLTPPRGIPAVGIAAAGPESAYSDAPIERSVVVTARAEGDTLVVAVADTGTGFPTAFIDHAFSRFRRADSSRASASGGAGLGLAIVAEIMAAHGGRAEAANNPGAGATVTLRFPAAVTPAEPDPTDIDGMDLAAPRHNTPQLRSAGSA
jgi:two-component system, OmpR family, sensor kinase